MNGGRGNDHRQGGEAARPRRQRPREQPAEDAEDHHSGENLGAGLVAGAVAVGVAGLGFLAYKLFKNTIADSPAVQSTRDQQPRKGQERLSENQPSGWRFASMFRLPIPSLYLKSFWNEVKEIENEENQFQHESGDLLLQPECSRKYRHPYNKLDQPLHQLNADIIRIEKSMRKVYNEALLEVMSQLLDTMQSTDALFRFLFKNVKPAGSSYEHLRIGSPDEFDLNLILKHEHVCVGLQVVDLQSGHVGLKAPQGFCVAPTDVLKPWREDREAMSKLASFQSILNNWLDYESFLDRKSVFQWFNGVVDKALESLKYFEWSSVMKVWRSCSGPAITINVTMPGGKSFSMDLVPSFEFSVESLPIKIRKKLRRVQPHTKRTWYAIPKGPQRSSRANVWRTSLYAIERDLMNGKEHLKPTIRILKRIRDVEGWKSLSSYYIKTSFMWMLEDKHNWSLGLGQTLIDSMEKLQKIMNEGCIPYYWDDGHNLFETTTNKEQCKNIANRLQAIIQRFKKTLDDDTIDPLYKYRQ